MAGYLPPGWTEDMYENPLQHEAAWDELTDEARSPTMGNPVLWLTFV